MRVYEGNSLILRCHGQQRELKLRKRCRCRGASSGPRLSISSRDNEDGAITVMAGIHEMVCDVCSTPWDLDG